MATLPAIESLSLRCFIAMAPVSQMTHANAAIEPMRADRHRSGAAASGATHTWMQAHGAHWITVVGDVPAATLKQFAGALESKPR